MPYFGGASLSAVLKQRSGDDRRPAPRAREFVAALEAVQSPTPRLHRTGARRPEHRPAARRGRPTPDARWPRSRQLELRPGGGLDRGPAGRGAPARPPAGHPPPRHQAVEHPDQRRGPAAAARLQPRARPGRTTRRQATLGGTIAYMAPEHLHAIVAPTPEPIRQVDQRSDIYSLGMVLAEMLTGHGPFEQSASYSAFPLQIEAMAVERSKAGALVRAARPDVPWGLESIVRKCLDPDPARRYQQAEHLAEDLRRFLDDRPLRHAPELSRVERVPQVLRAATPGCDRRRVGRGGGLGGPGRRWPRRSRACAATWPDPRPARRRSRRATGSRPTTPGRPRRSAWSTRSSTARTTSAGGSPSASGRSPCTTRPPGPARREHPDWARLAPDDAAAWPRTAASCSCSLAGARVPLAPGDRARPPRGARAARPGRGDPRPAAVAGPLDRPGAVPGRCSATRRRPTAARRRADRDPGPTARDHYLLATSYARQGGPTGYAGRSPS